MACLEAQEGENEDEKRKERNISRVKIPPHGAAPV